MKESWHVAPSGDGSWSLRKSGATKAVGIYQTKSDAKQKARTYVRQVGGALYVHGVDGRIVTKNTYGSNATSMANR